MSRPDEVIIPCKPDFSLYKLLEGILCCNTAPNFVLTTKKLKMTKIRKLMLDTGHALIHENSPQYFCTHCKIIPAMHTYFVRVSNMVCSENLSRHKNGFKISIKTTSKLRTSSKLKRTSAMRTNSTTNTA